MTRRYEIQEIVSQDSHGVVFHAVDRETGADVVLRRFFPFGSDGGGLEGEERDAYNAAIARLKTVVHPTLRTILDGGCDPVDGMPYLVTEWVDGDLLSDHLRNKPLSAGSTKALLDHALEASQMLAAALGAEAIWVETEPETVILSKGQEGRGVTFWISPLRWLSPQGDRKSLAPLLGLGEAALHWQGRVISSNAGEGLGAWLKAITVNPERWTLEEARVTLHAAEMLVGSEPQTIVNAPTSSVPTVAMSPPASQPKLKHKASVMPWVFAALLILSCTGLLVWKKMRPPSSAESAGVAISEKTAGGRGGVPVKREITAEPRDPEAARREALNRRIAELSKEAAARPAALASGEAVEVEGVIRKVDTSSSGKTLYFEFQEDGAADTRWAGFTASDWPGHDIEKIKAYIGKRARFKGTIKKESSSRQQFVNMAKPEDLTVQP